MKRVLLAVCGLTPQVITETLFALHQQGRMVDAIRVLTTRPGREACLTRLLAPETGHFYRFLEDYGIDSGSVDFSSRHVVAVHDTYGRELDDISLEEDNESFLAACMDSAFELTADAGNTVFFSIAGGRKTMGACLSLAAQLYARPQDRIFHVLVSPEFESCRDFYYPRATSRPVELFDAQGNPFLKESRYAAVTLAPLPFFPLRNRLADRLLKRPEDPATMMLSLVRETRNELVVDLDSRTVAWKGFQLDLRPSHLAVYAFFGLRKKEMRCTRDHCRGCSECAASFEDIVSAQGEITRLYQRITRGGPAFSTSDSGILALSKENFNSYRTKINKEIEGRFGACDARSLHIASVGPRPGVRYVIPLDRSSIRIVH